MKKPWAYRSPDETVTTQTITDLPHARSTWPYTEESGSGAGIWN